MLGLYRTLIVQKRVERKQKLPTTCGGFFSLLSDPYTIILFYIEGLLPLWRPLETGGWEEGKRQNVLSLLQRPLSMAMSPLWLQLHGTGQAVPLEVPVTPTLTSRLLRSSFGQEAWLLDSVRTMPVTSQVLGATSAFLFHLSSLSTP